MKTIDLARRWLSQTKPHGSAASASFREDRYASYGTWIAWRKVDAHGNVAILVHPDSFSTSTSKVQNEVASAAREVFLRVFRARGDVSHEANRDAYKDRARDDLHRVENARNPQFWRDSAQRHITECVAYCRAFGVLLGPLPDIAGTLSKKERADG